MTTVRSSTPDSNARAGVPRARKRPPDPRIAGPASAMYASSFSWSLTDRNVLTQYAFAIRPTLPIGVLTELADLVAGTDRAGSDDPGVEAPEAELATERRVHEPHRVTTEALHELGAPGVGLGRDLDDR